jgi:hypothetical protein
MSAFHRIARVVRHLPALERAQAVAEYLRRFASEVVRLAIDHEEHWWCTCKRH